MIEFYDGLRAHLKFKRKEFYSINFNERQLSLIMNSTFGLLYNLNIEINNKLGHNLV